MFNPKTDVCAICQQHTTDGRALYKRLFYGIPVGYGSVTGMYQLDRKLCDTMVGDTL